MEKVKSWADKNKEKTLSEVLHLEPVWYMRDRIEELKLSVRAHNVLSYHLDPPLTTPNGVHFTVDELLALTVGQLFSIHNLGSKCFVEVLLRLYQMADKENVTDFEPILEAGRVLKLNCNTSRFLSDVVNKVFGTHFGSEWNVYAVLEVMEHPEKYPNISETLTDEMGLLSDYQFYCDTEKEASEEIPPAYDDEQGWLKLLSEDMEWLKRMEASDSFASGYFAGLSEHFVNESEDVSAGVPTVNFVGDRIFPQEVLLQKERPTIVYRNTDWMPQNVIFAHCDNLRELYSAFLAAEKNGKHTLVHAFDDMLNDNEEEKEYDLE